MTTDEIEKQDGFNFFRMLPWAKIVTWSVFLGLVYTLRSLFAVFFITFVISYICRNLVKLAYSPFGERPYIRKVIVVVTFGLLIFCFYLGGSFLVPNVTEQGGQVVKMVRDLRIHEDVDEMWPNLYKSFRYWLYEGSEAYEKDFAAYADEADPVKLDFEVFRANSKKIRDEFRRARILEQGEAVFKESGDSEGYKTAFGEWKREHLEAEEYLPNRKELEAAKEQDLGRDMSDEDFERDIKKPFGSTPVAWSNYLKPFILADLRKTLEQNLVKMQEYRARFKEEYIWEEGEEKVAALEKEEEWLAAFEAYYNDLIETEYEYDTFIRLENAKTPESFKNLEGTEAESDLKAHFKDEKERQFAATFRAYGFVDELNRKVKQDFLPGVAEWVANTFNYTLTLAFHLILSVFLSFFIVWDIPRLKTIIQKLNKSRISEFYNEVSPGLVSFGWLMGRAFQAQAIIASVNTALTFSALCLLDVPHRAFLCSIVFICSFIPVVGVIISSIPIVVVSLQLPGGIILALELVACVLLIHFIETTLLNPKIMGDMLELHPLMVLVILLVGEHFFGVWGLLLGVPVSVYIFRFVILRDPRRFQIKAVDDLIETTKQEPAPESKA